MKALVIGGGGREHALAWRLAQSDSVTWVFATPGNAGIAAEASCIPGDVASPGEMASLAETMAVDFTVVGPEVPLVAGIADTFAARGLPILAPSAAAAQLEGSKVFTKKFFWKNNIPTGEAAIVESESDLGELSKFGFPVALKADGLAAGKGVVIAHDEPEARQVGMQMLSGELVGDAGRSFLAEKFLEGREVSFIVLTDGERVFEFPPTQDHKQAFDDDKGPNTGGMGAYCDDLILTAEQRGEIRDRVIEPALAGLRRAGTPFKGFLYAGLMITAEGPLVLEFNVRLGDPETQPLLYRLTGDFGELLISAAHGALDASSVGWRSGSTACVVMSSGGYPGAYKRGFEIHGVGEAEEATGAKVFHAGTQLRQGKLVTSGGRVLGVTAAGDDLEGALAVAYGAAERISFEGAHYRRDIGRRPVGKR